MGERVKAIYADMRDFVTAPLAEEVSLLTLFAYTGLVLLVILPAWGWILYHMRRAAEFAGE